jgi:hypothetical protein
VKDTILVDGPHGRVEITVQTKDVAAHAALSNNAEDWQQLRRAVQWLVEGALAPKETRTC